MALGLKVYLNEVLLMEIGFFLGLRVHYILAAGHSRTRRARSRLGFLWNSGLALAL